MGGCLGVALVGTQRLMGRSHLTLSPHDRYIFAKAWNSYPLGVLFLPMFLRPMELQFRFSFYDAMATEG
eukprot:2155324-Amphidinium_carterae.1